MKKILFVCVGLLCAGAGWAVAQTPVEIHKAELSIPFGSVSGKIILVGDYFVFADEREPESSFAVSRAQIKTLNSERDSVILVTNDPVTGRAGDRSEMTFRLEREGDAPMLSTWFRSAGTGTMASTSSSMDSSRTDVIGTYRARHDHLFGSCQGQVIVTENSVNYESVDNISHSRQWVLSDIKEVKLDSPYKLEIKPFTGDDYTLRLLGTSMNTQAFNNLVARITAARIKR